MCIDDVFDYIEKGVKQVIYYHLERNGLRREDIADNPVKFHRIMHHLSVFGDIVEEKIIGEFRRLCLSQIGSMGLLMLCI